MTIPTALAARHEFRPDLSLNLKHRMAHLPVLSVSFATNLNAEFKLNDPLTLIMLVFSWSEASGFISGSFSFLGNSVMVSTHSDKNLLYSGSFCKFLAHSG